MDTTGLDQDEDELTYIDTRSARKRTTRGRANSSTKSAKRTYGRTADHERDDDGDDREELDNNEAGRASRWQLLGDGPSLLRSLLRRLRSLKKWTGGTWLLRRSLRILPRSRTLDKGWMVRASCVGFGLGLGWLPKRPVCAQCLAVMWSRRMEGGFALMLAYEDTVELFLRYR